MFGFAFVVAMLSPDLQCEDKVRGRANWMVWARERLEWCGDQAAAVPYCEGTYQSKSIPVVEPHYLIPSTGHSLLLFCFAQIKMLCCQTVSMCCHCVVINIPIIVTCYLLPVTFFLPSSFFLVLDGEVPMHQAGLDCGASRSAVAHFQWLSVSRHGEVQRSRRPESRGRQLQPKHSVWPFSA